MSKIHQLIASFKKLNHKYIGTKKVVINTIFKRELMQEKYNIPERVDAWKKFIIMC